MGNEPLLNRLILSAYLLPVLLLLLFFVEERVGMDTDGVFLFLCLFSILPASIVAIVLSVILLIRAKRSGIKRSSTWAFVGLIYGVPYFCVGLLTLGLMYVMTQ